MEEKNKPAPAGDNDALAKIEEITRRVVREELGSLVVPNGYERCPVCGDLKKQGKKCPECAEREKPKDEPGLLKRLGF